MTKPKETVKLPSGFCEVYLNYSGALVRMLPFSPSGILDMDLLLRFSVRNSHHCHLLINLPDFFIYKLKKCMMKSHTIGFINF